MLPGNMNWQHWGLCLTRKRHRSCNHLYYFYKVFYSAIVHCAPVLLRRNYAPHTAFTQPVVSCQG